MKNTVKSSNIRWNAETIQKLNDNITRRIVRNPNQKMYQVYADIAKNSLRIFGKKLNATHIQKRASVLGVAPHGRKNSGNPLARNPRTSGFTVMYEGRSITEMVLQKALKLYDTAYGS